MKLLITFLLAALVVSCQQQESFYGGGETYSLDPFAVAPVAHGLQVYPDLTPVEPVVTVPRVPAVTCSAYLDGDVTTDAVTFAYLEVGALGSWIEIGRVEVGLGSSCTSVSCDWNTTAFTVGRTYYVGVFSVGSDGAADGNLDAGEMGAPQHVLEVVVG